MKPFVAPPSIYPLDEWQVVEESFEEQHRQRNETIFTVGNGYIGMRGGFEENDEQQVLNGVNGTYLNGFYDSEPIVYPEGAYGYAKQSQTMLNVANTRIIRIEVDGELFSLHTGKVLAYNRELDMRTGVLTRTVDWESKTGKQVRIVFRRFVCLAHKHLAAIQCEITALNFQGSVSITSSINGEVKNQAAADDPRVGAGFSGQVLRTEEVHTQGERTWIRQRTKNTGFALVAATAQSVLSDRKFMPIGSTEGQSASVGYQVPVTAGQPIYFTKYMVYFSSKDCPEPELADRAMQLLDEALEQGYDALLAEQKNFLDDFWSRTDVKIEGDKALQQGIRYNMYQLLQSTGRDGKTNIGAKGLTGEGYEGHYFWDTETFVLPFFIYTTPTIAKDLLAYRYNTLDKARERAEVMSQKGALYPWRTINGEETSAFFPAGTAQVHINADIINGLKRYYEATGDHSFMAKHGAEMLFETARFWADLGYHNPARDGKFCITAVTGPDEYTAIVDNNAYTNVMAKDHMEFAYRTSEWMKQHHPKEFAALAAAIVLSEEEPEAWRRAAGEMFIPRNEELGIIEQDDGFLMKEKWDFENTPDDKYPLLLHYHPLVIYRHQVLKQADVVLALFLQGHRFSLADKIRNYNYYEAITTHDSSLSPCIHSIVAAEIGFADKAYDYFIRTVRMDLDDINGNVEDGLHTASMAGSWLSIVNGFGGMRDYEGKLHFKPLLPKHWDSYQFKISYRERLIDIHVSPDNVTYRLLRGAPLEILHGRTTVHLIPGESSEISTKKRLEAVIFDLDGVITDTAEYHYLAWKELADDLGVVFDRETNEQLKGIGRMESLDILLGPSAANFTTEQKQVLAAEKNEKYKALIERITPNDLLPGIRPLLEELRASNVKMAVASASKNAVTVLRKLEIEPFFDVVVDPNSLAKGKPDPEIFLAAAEQLDVEPTNCIGIEDAAAGIEAIKAANMDAIGVGDPRLLSNADVVVEDPSIINLEMLEQQMAK
ncbi:hypothetical protein SD71_15545 [Cohnella kolymensis]|uniref:Beta-phosphoglucomutase n=1 Tax=Cohnella kolymensis TaxID=1590652 RepID=A0ABR5A1X9_9BACL|nr:beta-phosphoglucomutase [Cohnella kolymensis]KIL35068.1 hypothetical protein SD71_15545 [Cohnella kolymensis]